MKQYSYDRSNINTGAETEKIPAGAYVGKILNAKWEEGKDGKSDVIICQIDITEGEYANFFKKQYEANTREDKKYKGIARIWCPTGDGSDKDKRAQRDYNTAIANVEDSNPGFHWDGAAGEGQLRGKTIGIVLREKEYAFDKDGRHFEGTTTEFAWFADANRVREGKVKTPALRQLSAQQKSPVSAPATTSDGFMSVDPGATADWLPFD